MAAASAPGLARASARVRAPKTLVAVLDVAMAPVWDWVWELSSALPEIWSEQTLLASVKDDA